MILKMRKKFEITFILPTINRKKFVIRAIESCLKINASTDQIKAKVLVYDGYSDDGAWEVMQEKYEMNDNVTLKQVDRKLGFQETAFLALKDVNTEYCTYMYNDDVISEYYYQFANAMFKSQQNFIMGYGASLDINKVYKFKKPNFIKIEKKNIILGYFGIFKFLEYNSLPVSPVPSISKTFILRDWEIEVREFVKKSTFRKELMLKKNIGPDLMIYLYNLLLQKNSIVFCNSSIAQFSVHKKSMSIEYGKAPLSTGYWLSRVWYFEKCCTNKKSDKNFLSILSSYIIIGGVYIFFVNMINFKFEYSKGIFYEISKVVLKCFRNKIFLKTVRGFSLTILSRLTRNKKLLTPI